MKCHHTSNLSALLPCSAITHPVWTTFDGALKCHHTASINTFLQCSSNNTRQCSRCHHTKQDRRLPAVQTIVWGRRSCQDKLDDLSDTRAAGPRSRSIHDATAAPTLALMKILLTISVRGGGKTDGAHISILDSHHVSPSREGKDLPHTSNTCCHSTERGKSCRTLRSVLLTRCYRPGL